MASGYPDHEGDKSAVYSKSEYSTKIGTDKSLSFFSAAVVSGMSDNVTYVVPAGKTFHVTGLSFAIGPVALADREKPCVGLSRLERDDDSYTFVWLGGNGGNGIEFNKSHVFEAGETLKYHVINYSPDDANIGGTVWGYEV